MSYNTLAAFKLRRFLTISGIVLISTPIYFSFSSSALAEQTQLQAIKVKGEKLERTEMETITGVSIYTEEEIESKSEKTVLQVVQEVPNVTVGGYGGIANIRGVDGNGGGRSSYSWVGATRPRTSTIIDGVGQIWTGGNVLDNGLWDLEQIEVLRGPQSTAQGRSAIGGAIVITTKAPSFEKEAKVRLGMQQANGRNVYQAAGAVTGPITDDVAYRLSASLIGGEHYIDYVDNNPDFDYNTDPDDVRAKDIKAKLLWEPSSMPKLAARFDIQHQSQSGPYINSVESGDNGDYRAPMLAEDGVTGVVNHRIGDTTMNTYIANINYEINSTTETTVIASYTKFDSQYYHNQYNRSMKMDSWDQDSFNLEARVNFLKGAGNLSGMLGTSFIKDNQDIYIYFVDNDGDYTGDVFNGKTETQTLSLFGEGEYAFTNHFDLIFGGRIENESQKRDAEWRAIAIGLDGETLDETYFLPKIGARVTFNPNHVVGFDVRRGYTPGGLGWDRNNLSASASNTAYEYDPEYVTAFELSSKNQFLNNRASLNANVFYNLYTDYQAYSAAGVEFGDGSSGAGITNVDDATTLGLELEARAWVLERTELYATAGFLKTEVTKYEANPDWEGNELPFAANTTYVLGVNHSFTDSLSFGVNGRYVGEFYDDLDNQEGEAEGTNIAGDYLFVNLNATYLLGNATIRGYVNNLTNNYAVTYNDGITQNVLAPLTVGATLDYTF